MATKYQPQEFIRSLEEGNTQREISLKGMAKREDSDPHSVFFSPGNCGDWTPIPLASIGHVEVLGKMPCKDHSHPLVRIHLKIPTGSEHAFWAGLLQAHTLVMNRAGRRLGSGLCEKFCSECARGRDPESGACWICNQCNDPEEF